MTLEVLISTFGIEGIKRVAEMNLPCLANVSYLVSLQNPCREIIEIPKQLHRDDIRVCETDTTGLGCNRNNSIVNSRGDILLIADDDLVYTKDELLRVIKIFEAHPDIDFATFRYEGGDNKCYPDFEFDLSVEPKGYHIASVEIALRKNRLPKAFGFSDIIGVGNRLFGSGEENLFVYRMVRAGLKGRFFPLTIVRHPELTTGSRQATPSSLRGQGNWLRLRYGTFMGYLRLLRDIPRRNAPWFKSLFFMTQGFLLSYFYFTKDGADRKKITRHLDEQSL